MSGYAVVVLGLGALGAVIDLIAIAIVSLFIIVIFSGPPKNKLKGRREK